MSLCSFGMTVKCPTDFGTVFFTGRTQAYSLDLFAQNPSSSSSSCSASSSLVDFSVAAEALEAFWDVAVEFVEVELVLPDNPRNHGCHALVKWVLNLLVQFFEIQSSRPLSSALSELSWQWLTSCHGQRKMHWATWIIVPSVKARTTLHKCPLCLWQPFMEKERNPCLLRLGCIAGPDHCLRCANRNPSHLKQLMHLECQFWASNTPLCCAVADEFVLFWDDCEVSYRFWHSVLHRQNTSLFARSFCTKPVLFFLLLFSLIFTCRLFRCCRSTGGVLRRRRRICRSGVGLARQS